MRSLKSLKPSNKNTPQVWMGSLPLLSHAGPQFINRLTDLVNSILTDGVALESLLTGKMTLIDKKSPSLLVTNK